MAIAWKEGWTTDLACLPATHTIVYLFTVMFKPNADDKAVIKALKTLSFFCLSRESIKCASHVGQQDNSDQPSHQASPKISH
jgi:hypothetical protein